MVFPNSSNISSLNNRLAIQTQPQQVTQSAQNNAANNVQNSLVNSVLQTTSTIINNYIANSTQTMAQLYPNADTPKLQNIQMSNAIKELLQMDKDLLIFLSNFTNNSQNLKNVTTQQLSRLLLNSNADISKIIEFMQANGKEGIAKLISLNLQNTPVLKNSQIGEMMALIKACTPDSETTNAQVLKNIMLLYLPWLPIGEQDFRLELGLSGNGEESELGEDCIKVLIGTKSFGNITVWVFKAENDKVGFRFDCNKSLPQEEITKKLKTFETEYNIKTEVIFNINKNISEIKPENLNDNPVQNIEENKNTEIENKVIINASNSVNPFLLVAVNFVIKSIVDLDKNFTLLENRKKKL